LDVICAASQGMAEHRFQFLKYRVYLKQGGKLVVGLESVFCPI
jgi:hypothetical protein